MQVAPPLATKNPRLARKAGPRLGGIQDVPVAEVAEGKNLNWATKKG